MTLKLAQLGTGSSTGAFTLQTDDLPFTILSRGLPLAPTLEIPSYPQVDTKRSFTRESAMIYYSAPSVNGQNIDKWRVEWTEDASFMPDVLTGSAEVIPAFYNITGLDNSRWMKIISLLLRQISKSRPI